MPAAFECWNDSGYTQIDSVYPNLRQVQSGQVFCDQAIPGDVNPLTRRYYRDIALNADNPIVAFRCSSWCCSVGVGFNGTNYTHRFYTENRSWVDYWAFADAPAPITAGMEVYNQAGKLVFTSKDRPAKVMGQFQPPVLTFRQSVEFNIAGIRNLAVIVNSATFGMVGLLRTVQIRAYHARITNNATLAVSFDAVQETPPPYSGGEVFPTNNNYTLLDVYGQ